MVLACCPGCVLPLFTPAPCVFLASGVFPFQFGFLIDMRGSHLGVGFLVFSLVGSFPHCGSFCSSMCIVDAGVRFFLWVVYASLGLLALQGLGVMPVFFFLRPLLFRFLPDSVSSLCRLGRCLWGVAFPPWLSLSLSAFLGLSGLGCT